MEEEATDRRRSEKRQRTEQHRTRLTPHEKVRLGERAAEAGMEVGAYVRHQCLGTAGPRTIRRMTADLAELARVRGALGYVGNNLNQLTKLANIGDLDRPQELDRTLAAVLAILAEVRGLMADPEQ